MQGPRISASISPTFFKLFVAATAICFWSAARCDAQFLLTGNNQGVTFSQEFDYNEDGTADTTGTAAANVNFSLLKSASGINSSGYLNIVNSDGWVAENIPVFSNTSTYVDLTTGEGVDDTGSGTNQSVYFSATPLDTQPTNSTTNFTLSHDNMDIGGIDDDSTGVATFLSPDDITPTLNGITKSKIQANHGNVQAAVNQCAPAAAANGVAYLKTVFNNVSVPGVNAAGRGTPGGGSFPTNGNVYTANFDGNGGETQTFETTDTLVGEMDLAMTRASADRKTFNNNPTPQINNPTQCIKQLNGILRYLGYYGNAGQVAVNYESRGNALFTGATTIEGITPNAVNGGAVDKTTIDYLYSELTKGSMVNLDYTVVKRLQNGSYKAQYGHAVDVVGMAYVDAIPYVLLSSDLDQTNTDLDDDSLGGSDGLFWARMNAVNFQNKPFVYLSGAPGVDNQSTFAYISAIVTVDALPEPGSLCLIAGAGLLLFRRRTPNFGR